MKLTFAPRMLTSLVLYQYKNHANSTFDLSRQVHCFWGQNGVGKTNILDAIYYLCFTKSYFSSYDNQVIQDGKKEMFIQGTINEDKIKCLIRESGKKEILLNKIPYEKYSEHIGAYPAVMISPDDTILISGHSDVRRKFLDIILSQLDADYLQHLITYNKQLAQRNALLKEYKGKNLNSSLLNTYNEILSVHGTYIYQKRNSIIEELVQLVQQFYSEISEEKETVSIHYKSSVTERKLIDIFKENEQKDFYMQRTTDGIHRDDLVFSIATFPLKQYASQGQRKSFLFATKLAEFHLLKKYLNKKPMLLIDDLFEKLDAKRSQILVRIIANLNTQVFITDTDQARLKQAFAASNIDFGLSEIT